MLDAEVVVTTLVLPELLEGLTFEFAELKLLLLNGHVCTNELIDQLGLNAQVGECKLATMIVASSIRQFEPGVSGADSSLDFFPVDLELFSFFQLLHVELDDQRIVKVFLDKDDLSISADLVLLWDLFGSSSTLGGGLGISLALQVGGRQGLVVMAAALGLVVVDVDVAGVGARVCDLGRRDSHGLDLITVKEVSDSDPALLIGLDLFAEELVSAQVSVRQIVLNLLLDFSLGCSSSFNHFDVLFMIQRVVDFVCVFYDLI